MKRLTMLIWLSVSCLALASAETSKDHCEKSYSTYKDRVLKNPTDSLAWTEFRVCTTELKKWDEAIQVALQVRQKNRDLA